MTRQTASAVLLGLALVALSLRAADAIAGLVAAVPRGVHLCATLADAEARTGIPLDSLRRILDSFPVARREIRRTTPAAVAVVLHQREHEENRIAFFQSARGEIPTLLRPRLPAFHEITASLGPGRTANLRAASLSDGSVWQDLEWSEGEGHAALRSKGRTVELLQIARQLVERAP